MILLSLSGDDLERALPIREAVEAMKSAFAALSAGRAVAPRRVSLPVEEAGGITLLMGAYLPDEGLAAKTVSIFHRNRELGKPAVGGLVLVMDPTSGEPVGLMDGGALTAWRTGAASGAATDLLARGDARVGALLGAGVQARTQVRAIDAVRPLEAIRVYDPHPDRVAGLVADVGPLVRARLEPAPSAAEAVSGADIVCTATSSAVPVFDGRFLAPGAHVNAIGTFTLDHRELDLATVERSRVFVDHVQAALAEAGELVAAMREGLTGPDEWTEIGLVAAGAAPGRADRHEVTLFKSVGHAVQDVAAASRALRAARQLGLGREIEV